MSRNSLIVLNRGDNNRVNVVVIYSAYFFFIWDRHGRDPMVVMFTNTCAISAFQH